MDMMDKWDKAIKNTEIIRSRVQPLHTFETTKMEYVFLSESVVNVGDTVVRKGEVLVDKPSIILPENIPHFEGFEFDEDMQVSDESVINFLLVRGIRFPSYKYNNLTRSLDVFEGSLSKAIDGFADKLERKEDVRTGLVAGPEDCWQFSILIFICAMVGRSADRDIKNLLDEMRKKRGCN